jgi:hypothetical protein
MALLRSENAAQAMAATWFACFPAGTHAGVCSCINQRHLLLYWSAVQPHVTIYLLPTCKLQLSAMCAHPKLQAVLLNDVHCLCALHALQGLAQQFSL